LVGFWDFFAHFSSEGEEKSSGARKEEKIEGRKKRGKEEREKRASFLVFY